MGSGFDDFEKKLLDDEEAERKRIVDTERKAEDEKITKPTADDIKIMHIGATVYRKMDAKQKVRYKVWMDRLRNIMDNAIISCIGQDNRITMEELMQKLFLEVPADPQRYDEYRAIIKRLFWQLKMQYFRPYISCRGYAGKGPWGYAIPDDGAFKNYDDFLSNLKRGLTREQDRSEKVFKQENKDKEVSRDATGQATVVAADKKEEKK